MREELQKLSLSLMVNFGDDDINRETVGFGARDPTTDNDQPN